MELPWWQLGARSTVVTGFAAVCGYLIPSSPQQVYTTWHETICNYPELYKSIKEPFRVMCNVAISWMCFIPIIAPHSQDTASSIGNPLKYIAADRGRLPHWTIFIQESLNIEISVFCSCYQIMNCITLEFLHYQIRFRGEHITNFVRRA